MGNVDRFGLNGNTIAGTFRVDQVVAEGGFGVVYRAFHLHFRSPVALKCLKIPGALSDIDRQDFLEQFRSEAEIQFRLSAALPHIVRPLHVDSVQTSSGEFVPLMVLEWLEGQSFEAIIEERNLADLPPIDLAYAIELIGPAAHTLHTAHRFETGGDTLTVIHRDIKPDNLFVTEVGGKKIVKILDFGISKVRRAATQLAGHYSQTGGSAPFSPAYGAPEQWVPKRFGQTGPWTDVWGLALTLVEIIKGDAVIVGDHQAMMGTTLDPKVRPTPRSEGVLVSDEVESVFQKALALDPRYRYQSIESFWDSLQAAVDLSSGGPETYAMTPSGSRIPLPKMSAPTPWTSPKLPVSDAELVHLPPMMAPARMQATSAEDLELRTDASFPTDPHSDLMPVLAAPTSWDHFDPDVPPSSSTPPFQDGGHPIAPLSSRRLPDRHELQAERGPFEVPFLKATENTRQEPSSEAQSSIPQALRGAQHPAPVKLELQSTSDFPQRAAPASETRSEAPSVAETRAQPPEPPSRVNALISSIPDLDPPGHRPSPPSARSAAEFVRAASPPVFVEPNPSRPPPPTRSVRPPAPIRTSPPIGGAPLPIPGRARVPRPVPPRPSRAQSSPETPKDSAADEAEPLSLVPTKELTSSRS